MNLTDPFDRMASSTLPGTRMTLLASNQKWYHEGKSKYLVDAQQGSMSPALLREIFCWLSFRDTSAREVVCAVLREVQPTLP